MSKIVVKCVCCKSKKDIAPEETEQQFCDKCGSPMVVCEVHTD